MCSTVARWWRHSESSCWSHRGIATVGATPYYECLSMRDKRTHRNYARNSLNLTFLLRYTGSACSEVTNFIGKRAIYRSPRSHTISAPPRRKPVYTRAHVSVHTDSNKRFANPERSLRDDDGSFHLASIYDIELYPDRWK